MLYKDWDPAVWDFGTAPNADQQLPGLKFNGQVLRDSDGDGVLDENDVWPNNFAASKDLDADGYPDAWSLGCDDACIVASGLTLDQFPHHAWAALDADFDGLPDGADNCVSNCELDGLTKDGALGDYDNDGILDAVDSDEDNDGIDDIDANHNGLIDIDSLEKLNAMRFQLKGIGLQLTDISDVDSSGCPRIIYQGIYQQRCSGYELTQDLDFDTNANGGIDAGDEYRNITPEGIAQGWEPIGSSDRNYFSAIFNGNGHVIKNLNINRPQTYYIGLFGYINNSVIENVVIAGANSEITGGYNVAALVGYASNAQIRNVVVAANVQGNDYVAGLIGQVYSETHIRNSLVSGSVSGDRYVAGLVGKARGSNSNSKNTIIQSLSTSFVVGNSSVGGLISYSYNTNIINSYWAKDVSGQYSSASRSEANSYVGLNLSVLQCATAENTDFTTGCVSVDGSAEVLGAAVVLYKDWDPAVWDFGTAPNANQQLPGLKLNGKVFRDSDGDGLLDVDDASPFDHDNDGVIDIIDGYPFIAIGDLADQDSDGLPNECDQECIGVGMTADIDDDNDGSIDTLDAYPLIPVGGLDADYDGIPDECNQVCINLGMIQDQYLNDTDNDGATNDVDSDFESDNGKPTLLAVPETLYAVVNTADGSGFIVDSLTVDSFLSQFKAEDIIDPVGRLTAKVYLNSKELVLDDNGGFILPSGLLALNWVAVDSSGNESESLEQLVYVYPQVRFNSSDSITGEVSQAKVIVELTGDSPEYPVSISLLVNSELSSIDQADLDSGFDFSVEHVVVIEAGDDAELLNRQASLIVPVIEDYEREDDELLVLELQSVASAHGAHEFIVIDESKKTHELKVTYRNLAPLVRLLILQGGQAVTSITMDGGIVTLLANVSDGNGADTHTFNWDLGGLITQDFYSGEMEFDPANLYVGEYLISLTVTDDGISPLSKTVSQALTVIKEESPVIKLPEKSSSGSGSGGSMNLIFLLMMVLLILVECFSIRLSKIVN